MTISGIQFLRLPLFISHKKRYLVHFCQKDHDKNAQKSQNKNVKRSPEKFANNLRMAGGKEMILTETTTTASEYALEYIHILTLFILLPSGTEIDRQLP